LSYENFTMIKEQSAEMQKKKNY